MVVSWWIVAYLSSVSSRLFVTRGFNFIGSGHSKSLALDLWLYFLV